MVEEREWRHTAKPEERASLECNIKTFLVWDWVGATRWPRAYNQPSKILDEL